MPLKPANMDICTPKCKCKGGVNAGRPYDCTDPCGALGQFDLAACDCTEVIPCGGSSTPVTGTSNGSVNSYSVPVTPGTSIVFSYSASRDTFAISGAASYYSGSLNGSGSIVLPITENVGYITITSIGSGSGGWSQSFSVQC